jgi:hypothetical protein
MATSNAAQALAVDDALGAIRPGLVGDLAVYDLNEARNPFLAVMNATPAETALVVRGGKALYGDEAIMAAVSNDEDGCEVVPDGVCGRSKSVCVSSEVSQSFAQLASANRNSYQLFACGVPENEPTCVPSRPGEFDGTVSEDDPDGDGLVDELDNCPTVFNPPRPVDGDIQGDHDGDGLGDVCDPCPVDPDTEDCTTPDPADSDADGVLNVQDNCPDIFNPDQDDFDQDGKGDECDACPEDFNPGIGGCPFSIYDIKSGVAPVGSRVKTGGVVSAVAEPRFFIQVPESDRNEENGASFSGVFIFVPRENPDMTPVPKVGDVVEVEASVSEFFGQLQLNFITEMTIVEESVPPSPVEVDAQDVATDGRLAAELEGVLVKAECTVESLEPLPGAGDEAPTNEYLCEGGLRINDLIHLTEPFPLVGEVLEITGVLRRANEHSKIEPRGPEDIRFISTVEPELATFGSEVVFAEVIDSLAETTPTLTLILDRPAF